MAKDHSGLSELPDFHRKLGEYQELLAVLVDASTRTVGPLVVSRGSQRPETVARIESLRQELVRQRGVVKGIVLQLTGKSPYAEAFGRTFDVWDLALEQDPSAPLKSWALQQLADATNEAIGILETGRVRPRHESSDEALPKAFIAHGGQTRALERLCGFLRTLGIEPIVVEQRPSEGRSPDQQVQKHVQDADCGIIFATKGGIRD
ncbi:MAG: hypothetical protein Q8R28_10840, partial [Dehalococcoidia bacterium]|nr:hypothetical protein [Dehalococcoidia bacterium]